MIIDAQDDMTVVAEAADGLEAVEQTRGEHPDVVLMDIRMPGIDGIEATRRLVADGCTARIVMLTTFALDDYLYEAMRAGASGFLLKTAPPLQLVAAIRDVTTGDTLLAPTMTRRLIEEFMHRPRPEHRSPTGLDRLTPREHEVFVLIARGLSNTELAHTLFVSETTAKTHVARVLSKLGVRDRVQAVVLAYESGVIRPGEHQ
jgi:DNA-binding NarL/FixJ family response regulator